MPSGSTTGKNGDHEIRRDLQAHRVRHGPRGLLDRRRAGLPDIPDNALDNHRATMVQAPLWEKEEEKEPRVDKDRGMDKGKVVGEVADNKDKDSLQAVGLMWNPEHMTYHKPPMSRLMISAYADVSLADTAT